MVFTGWFHPSHTNPVKNRHQNKLRQEHVSLQASRTHLIPIQDEGHFGRTGTLPPLPTCGCAATCQLDQQGRKQGLRRLLSQRESRKGSRPTGSGYFLYKQGVRTKVATFQRDHQRLLLPSYLGRKTDIHRKTCKSGSTLNPRTGRNQIAALVLSIGRRLRHLANYIMQHIKEHQNKSINSAGCPE